MGFYYVCHSCYNCRCEDGKGVTYQIAMSHRRRAEMEQLSNGNLVFVPLPTKMSQSSSTIDNEPDLEQPSRTEELRKQRLAPPPASCSTSEQDGARSDSDKATFHTATQSLSQSPSARNLPFNSEFPSDYSSGNSLEYDEPVPELVTIAGSRDFRLYAFMRTHSNLVGIAIKHHTTETLMEDLMHDFCRDDPPELRFKSFKGLKNALYWI